MFLIDHYKNVLTDVGLGDVGWGGDGRATLASYSLSPPLLELSVILSEMRVLTAAKSDGISGKYGPPILPQQDSKQVVNT